MPDEPASLDDVLWLQSAQSHDGYKIKNRLVKAAMVEGLASIRSGSPNEQLYRLYDVWSQAGYGMMISGNAMVCRSHLGTPGDLRIPEEIDEIALRTWSRLAISMQSRGALGIVQLVHTGRQSVRGAGRWPWQAPLAPSSVRLSTDSASYLGRLVEKIAFQMPREMSIKDIQNVIKQFVHGFRLAQKAGFKGIQLHASHGYLLSSFLSPKTNKRRDDYGGSPQARLRIILEIADAIRTDCPRPFVVGIKLNSADYVDSGLTEEEALLHIASMAKHGGFDFIEISGGNYESLAFLDDDIASRIKNSASTRSTKREAIFSAFASQAKRVAQEAASTVSKTAPMIMCTGGFRTKKGMLYAIQEDGIDLIGIGRAAAVDPLLPQRLLGEGNASEEEGCIDYSVRGGEWLRSLIPLGLVGGSLTTLWHQMQMWRIARGHPVGVDYSFEYLIFLEIWYALQSAFGIALIGLAGAVLWLAKHR